VGEFWCCVKMEAIRDSYLDIGKERIFVYSRDSSCLVVAVMREGIKLGCEFPAIDVECLEDGSYVISNGHHRAWAHYAEGSLCKSEFSGKAPEGVYFFPFKETVLSYEMTHCARHRLIDSLNCLPRDVAERFCMENRLDPCEYLSQ